MTLEKSAHENDRVFDNDIFKVVIKKDFDHLYENLVIDYVKGFLGKGFTISENGKSSSCC